MKNLIAIAGFALLSLAAQADYEPTNVSWRGWEISSSEDLTLGRNYSSVKYSLANLIDGRPETAWVFRGKKNKTDQRGTQTRRTFSITLRSDKPFTADQIRLMNGYDKSQQIFLRNNRITKVQLTVGDAGSNYAHRPLKTVSLSDKMGWHAISLPRAQYTVVKLEFTAFVRGRDNDICVSELELSNRGRKIDFGAPKVVMFSEGSECG